MNILHVKTPEGEYPIHIGAGALDHARFDGAGVCALITNSRVRALHAPRVLAALRARGFDPRVIVIPDGEQFKNLDTLRAIYDQLIDARLERSSIIFALGGGVVGDVAGFAAATFLRGVVFVQMPTTLLAMVDSSIGGKVGVDHPRGKNLIGAFKQPRAVIADTTMLATLPDVEWRAGMAEVVKHGIIGDAELFEILETRNWKLEIGNWIARAIRVKVEIVARDPFERGERAKLNLGHTFAHALETLSDYRLRHGEAVAIGLVCATWLAARRGLCDDALIARIENLLRAIGLPTRVPREFSADALFAAMQTDKKRVGARLRFILPRAIGAVALVDDVPMAEVIAGIEKTR
ncbi:MAG: 3-dehydroquinate synthase [Chloroflexi bacterium]|nr:3-dehydroquinate synthase [Chloroflexota bacterium]